MMIAEDGSFACPKEHEIVQAAPEHFQAGPPTVSRKTISSMTKVCVASACESHMCVALFGRQNISLHASMTMPHGT